MSEASPTILITNDDGYRAPGIRALAKWASPFGQVVIVAPDRERSACGHSLTLHRPLRIEQAESNVWVVDGTPTDCVNIAVRGDVLPMKPDYVFCGINQGANLGDDVTYSGTVAGAMEGALLGCTSAAFSCLSLQQDDEVLTAIEPWVTRILTKLMQAKFGGTTFVNVNIPNPKHADIQAIEITRQGRRFYEAEVVEKQDPRRRKYYWIGGDTVKFSADPGTDVGAVYNGNVSVTPLQLDLTDHDTIHTIQTWSLEKNHG